MNEQQDKAGIKRNWPAYEVCGVLGHGAYGQVYKIKREYLGNITYSALKVVRIPPDPSMRYEMESWGMTDEKIEEYYKELAQDFLKENAVMEKLKGAANIVIIEDCIVEKGEEGNGYTIYIKMELLESLESMMRSYKLGPDDIVTVGKDICDALIACEQKNVVHRDIKPANVFINSFGTFKLGDFGAAKQMQHTKTSMTQIGTGMYMAPELYRGEAADKRVDIYSLGIMLYRIANQGCFPFVDPDTISPACNQDALLKRLKGEELPLPSQVDEELGRIIVKACAHRAADRYDSARKFKNALEGWEAKKKYGDLATDGQKISSKKADEQEMSWEKQRIRELEEEKRQQRLEKQKIKELEEQIKRQNEELEQLRKISQFMQEDEERWKSKYDIQKHDVCPVHNLHSGESYFSAIDKDDVIEFGNYNDKPIKWIVLHKEKNKALLISKYCLLDKPYNDDYVAVTWEKCTLRKWLNDDFLEISFSKEEKQQIIEVQLENEDNSRHGTKGGSHTYDKLFLLSIEEAEKYFYSNNERKATYDNGSPSWWWLRSHGYYDKAALVDLGGSVYEYGLVVDRVSGAVRPALWIKLK